jgi:hypothetical protein
LEAKRKKGKVMDESDIESWYDKINGDTSPEDVFWEEMDIWGSHGHLSPYAYGDSRDPGMHTGIFQSLTVCIQEIFPYGKSSLVSPYA